MSSKTKILIAEDNDFIRMQIVHFLKEAGYDPVEARDGSQALELLTKDVLVAIVDVRMEPLDGFEFIRAVRGKGLSTHIVLVTGDQNPDLLNEASKWGVLAVLMKPVQQERLIKIVERAQKARPPE